MLYEKNNISGILLQSQSLLLAKSRLFNEEYKKAGPPRKRSKSAKAKRMSRKTSKTRKTSKAGKTTKRKTSKRRTSRRKSKK